MFGSAVVNFALAWYLARETGSATVLSVSMIAGLIPPIVLGPFIGPFIDRWNRKMILIVSDLVAMLLTVVLVLLFYAGITQVWHIYLLIVGRSIAMTFQHPAFQASIPMIVSKEHLVRANGLNQSLRGFINVVGPPAGAFLMEALPMQGVLAVDIITALIAVGCLVPLVIPQPSRETLSARPGFFADMMQGLRYILSWRGLLFLYILIGFMNFFGAPTMSLTPLFVTLHLGADVLRLGWLQMSVGVGMVSGGLLLNVWPGFRRRIVTCFIGIILQSIVIFIFSFLTERFFISGIFLWFLLGLGNAMAFAALGVILQSTVARDMQGRVFSVLGSVMGAMMPLGLAVGGPVADVIGVRMVFAIAGAAIFVLALAAFFSHDLMNVESQQGEEIAGK